MAEQVSGEVCVENDCVIEGLLKVPFNRRKYNEKVEIVKMERPTPELNLSMDGKEKQPNTMEPPLKRRQGEDEVKYRQLYYSILDRMHMEITDRFSDYGKLQFTHLLDSQKFSAYRENFPNEALNKLFQSYNSHFDQDRGEGGNEPPGSLKASKSETVPNTTKQTLDQLPVTLGIDQDVSRSVEDDFNTTGDEEYNERLKRVIQNHQEVISFVGEVQDVLSEGILVQFVVLILGLCLSAFLATIPDMDPNIRIKFGTIVVSSICQLLLPCWFGQRIINESERIEEVVYDCGWEDRNTDYKTKVAIMLMRSQSPLHVTVGKFAILSLETWLQVVLGLPLFLLSSGIHSNRLLGSLSPCLARAQKHLN
ncbi:hypothetical protein ANN_24937 [Periplaneta americana]|uniref:Odorant receptor n=1 Tax=Periplaneta americana TaxID=6978 RepID=A0ABQ8RZZ8_PERAM|nr:hypothetical protein ANN_24937 [Periplaneta americana]